MISAAHARLVFERVLLDAAKQRSQREDPPLLSDDEISRALAEGEAAMRAAIDAFAPPTAPRGRFR